METAFAALSLRDNVIPPTLNLDNIDPALCKENDPFHHVPHKKLEYGQVDGSSDGSAVSAPKELKYALKNSFGFGGTNASLLLGKYKQ